MIHDACKGHSVRMGAAMGLALAVALVPTILENGVWVTHGEAEIVDR